jgi:4-hydroxybenzoate polyprenyltransferase
MISRDRLPDFIALMRLDRPIGIWLLLWPTLIAKYGAPPTDHWLAAAFSAAKL